MNILKNAVNSLYLYRNGYLATLDRERFHSIVGKSLLFRIRIVFTNTLKEFKLLFHRNPVLNIDDKIVCIINSKNNYESLSFLKSQEVLFLKPTILGGDIENVISYRFKSKFFYSLLFILYLPFIVVKKENRRDLILLHKAFGLEHLFIKKILKHKPRKVVFTNDHTPEARSFILACQKAGIETVYLQHGSVSKYFPPLEFNLALLESQYSKDIYVKSKNIDTKIELIGIPKLDKEISKIRDRNTIETIGVAINQNDDLQIVKSLLGALIENNYKVILRKHPADIRKFASHHNIQDGNEMTVFEFIHLSDFIVASDSSIHVEANSLKCRSVYFKLHDNDKKYDYYGFVKNGFVDEVLTIPKLLNVFEQFNYEKFDFFASKINYYNSSLTQKLYGLSSNRAIKEILRHAKV